MENLRLFRDTSIYAVGGIADRAVQFLFIPFYMMKLEPAELGSLSLLLLFGELITKFIHAPANAGLIRYFHSPKYQARQAQLVFTLMIFSAAFSLMAALIFLAAANSIVGFLAGGNFVVPGKKLFLMVLVFSPVIFLKPVAQINLTYLRMCQQPGMYVLLSITRLALTTCMTLYGLFVLQWGALAPVTANLCGTMLIAFSAFATYLRLPGKSVSREVLDDALRYGFPLIPSAYSVLVIDSGDRFLLKIIKSVDAVGIYSIAYGLADVLNTVLIQPLKQSIQPAVHKLESEPEKLRDFVNTSCLVYCLFGSTVSLMLALFSQEILELLSNKASYQTAWPVVPILCLSYFIRGLGQFAGYGMVMANKSGLISIGLLFSATMNIVLNLVTVPHYGMLGAAWATVVSYFIWGFWKAHFSKRYYDLRFQWLRIISVSLYAIFVYLIAHFICQEMSLLLRLPVKLLLLSMFLLSIWQAKILPEKMKTETYRLLCAMMKKFGMGPS